MGSPLDATLLPSRLSGLLDCLDTVTRTLEVGGSSGWQTSPPMGHSMEIVPPANPRPVESGTIQLGEPDPLWTPVPPIHSVASLCDVE